jgi:hypothetical protein
VAAAREKIASLPETPKLNPQEAERLHGNLKAALEQISDDDAMRAFLARLVAEAVMLKERAAKSLAFDAARRRGYPAHPHYADLSAFSARFNKAQAKAMPRRLLPFLGEFDGWLARISGAGQDLFFYAA